MTDFVVSSAKESIKNSFESGAATYRSEARLQESVAQRLAASLKPWKMMLPKGPILEMGAGTGFFTKELATLFPGVEMDVTDISEEMLRECSKYMGDNRSINYIQTDIEERNLPENHYSLITGNFVAQWFKDPAATLTRLIDSLKSGGLLLTSFPGEKSFPEWEKFCRLTETPFTRNRLPNIEELAVKLSMESVKIDYHEDTDAIHFDSSIDFFRHLKQIGAATKVKREMVSPGQFRNLLRRWDLETDNRITVSYHLVYLAVVKS